MVGGGDKNSLPVIEAKCKIESCIQFDGGVFILHAVEIFNCEEQTANSTVVVNKPEYGIIIT